MAFFCARAWSLCPSPSAMPLLSVGHCAGRGAPPLPCVHLSYFLCDLSFPPCAESARLAPVLPQDETPCVYVKVGGGGFSLSTLPSSLKSYQCYILNWDFGFMCHVNILIKLRDYLFFLSLLKVVFFF